MKKTIVFAIVLAFVATMAFAQGAQAAPAASQKVVTTVCRASYATEEWYNKMNADFEAETGIHVDVQPTPGNDADHDAKVNIDLLAGGTIDVIPSLGPKYFQDRVEAGFFAPLSGVVKNADEAWGSYLPKDESGEFYGLPFKQELWNVYYNKDLFDRAGVPYPTAPWTWDDFVETAKKVTDPANGIYGAYLSAENPWTIMSAKQCGVPLYKEDGSCNFDDPAFAESLKWYKSLGDQGIAMPVSEIKSENASWNYYALAGDKLAMFPQGNWFTRLLNSQVDYPRDWKYGVVATPSAGPNGNNNFCSAGYVSINKNAAHPEEAAIYCAWLGENQWKYEGGIPALAVLSAEDQELALGTVANNSNGQVTVEDLYNNWIATGMGVEQSDILGTAADEYNRIVNSEIEAYFLDMQSLDVTIANIVAQVNEAIANVK